MKYTLFLAHDPANSPVPGTDEFKTYIMAYGTFGQELSKAGAFIAGEPIEAADTATTLRKVGDEIQLHDGPFAETKEQISGWYLLECKDLDEAVKWAKRVPMVAFGYGTVEIRPVVDMSGGIEGMANA